MHSSTVNSVPATHICPSELSSQSINLFLTVHLSLYTQLSEVKGPTRLVQLQPIHILTHEITLILSSHGGRLAINQIVPEYKEMFGRHPIFSQYGFTKLIKALETMSDTITVSCV